MNCENDMIDWNYLTWKVSNPSTISPYPIDWDVNDSRSYAINALIIALAQEHHINVLIGGDSPDDLSWYWESLWPEFKTCSLTFDKMSDAALHAAETVYKIKFSQ